MKRLASVCMFILIFTAPVHAADIIAEWDMVIAPEKPAVSAVTVDAATTALLVLDIEERTCNAERRPRCLDTVPKIAALLAKARAANASVAHSNTSSGSVDTILPPAKPLKGEPVVSSSVNKFFGTNLDEELKARNVSTVIVTGTAAHGAVLHTATAASQMGYTVIVPVDGLSASTLYIEQATVINLIDGPGTRRSTTLTRTDMITFE